MRDDGDDIQVIDLGMAARIHDRAAGCIAPRPWWCACFSLYLRTLTCHCDQRAWPIQYMHASGGLPHAMRSYLPPYYSSSYRPLLCHRGFHILPRVCNDHETMSNIM